MQWRPMRARIAPRDLVECRAGRFGPALRRHLDAAGFAAVQIENGHVRMPASRRRTVGRMGSTGGTQHGAQPWAEGADHPQLLGRAARRRLQGFAWHAVGVDSP